MADIKISALAELTSPADGDMVPVYDVSEAVGEKTKRILFSTLRKAALADADGDTKITMDLSADEDVIRFFTGSGGQQVNLSDGALVPSVDNDVDMGSTSARFKLASFVKYFTTSTFYAYFPTNSVTSDSKIMMGNASTVAWFFNNTAPPGWKVTGVGDAVLRTGATGGITGGSWTVSGCTLSGATGNATWTGAETPSHAGVSGDSAQLEHTHTYSATVSSDATWRPLGYIGKLFLLDAA